MTPRRFSIDASGSLWPSKTLTVSTCIDCDMIVKSTTPLIIYGGELLNQTSAEGLLFLSLCFFIDNSLMMLSLPQNDTYILSGLVAARHISPDVLFVRILLFLQYSFINWFSYVRHQLPLVQLLSLECIRPGLLLRPYLLLRLHLLRVHRHLQLIHLMPMLGTFCPLINLIPIYRRIGLHFRCVVFPNH